jgi:hypothetical protein
MTNATAPAAIVLPEFTEQKIAQLNADLNRHHALCASFSLKAARARRAGHELEALMWTNTAKIHANLMEHAQKDLRATLADVTRIYGVNL